MKKFKENVLDVLAYVIRALLFLVAFGFIGGGIFLIFQSMVEAGWINALKGLGMVLGIIIGMLVIYGVIALAAVFSEERIEEIKRKKQYKLDK